MSCDELMVEVMKAAYTLREDVPKLTSDETLVDEVNHLFERLAVLWLREKERGHDASRGD